MSAARPGQVDAVHVQRNNPFAQNPMSNDYEQENDDDFQLDTDYGADIDQPLSEDM